MLPQKDISTYNPGQDALTISMGGAKYDIWGNGASYIGTGGKNRAYPSVRFARINEGEEGDVEATVRLNMARVEQEKAPAQAPVQEVDAQTAASNAAAKRIRNLLGPTGSSST